MSDLHRYWFGRDASRGFRLATLATVVISAAACTALGVSSWLGIAIVVIATLAVQVAITVAARSR